MNACLRSLVVGALLSLALNRVALAVPVTTGLNTWLDASDPTTILDAEGDNALSGFFSGSVQTWTDKSGNGRDAVQATAVNQPTYITNAIGGQSAILTDGLDNANRDFLRVSLVGGLVKPEYVVVTRIVARTTNDILLSDPANGYHTGTYTAAAGNIATLASSGAILAQRPLAVGQVGIVRQFFDRGSGGATSQFAVNGGITNFTLGAGDYSTASLNTLDIGAFTPDTTHSQNAQVAEVLIYNAGLSNAERNILENYLSAKYSGTTGVHQVPIVNDLYVGDDSAQGHFDFGVFGIGQHPDASVVTTGTTDGLTISQDTVLGSDEWVLAGHAGGPNGITTSDMPGGQRWERSWYIDATSVSSAELAFDWNDAGVTAAFDSDFNGLYYREFNSGSFNLVAVGTVDIGNQWVDFLGVNFPTEDGYYTLGIIPVPEPSTLALLGLGAIGLAIKGCRRRAAA